MAIIASNSADRVLLAYLTTAGLVEHIVAVATRGRVKCVWVSGDGDVTVNVGPPRILADRPVVTAALPTAPVSAIHVVSTAS